MIMPLPSCERNEYHELSGIMITLAYPITYATLRYATLPEFLMNAEEVDLHHRAHLGMHPNIRRGGGD